MRYLTVSLLLVGFSSCPAYAASFDCANADLRIERAICADPVLSQFDEDLAHKWQVARRVSDYPRALRADEQDWIGRRDLTCGRDIGCLRNAYRLRIMELNSAVISGPFHWAGIWYASRNPKQTMRIEQTDTEHFTVTIATPGTQWHTTGPAELSQGELSYNNVFEGDSDECHKIIRRVHRQIEIENVDPGCAYGSSGYFTGRYLPLIDGAKRLEAPYDNMLGIGVVIRPKDDTRLRRLLGHDAYRTLYTTFDSWTGANDIVDAGLSSALVGIGLFEPDASNSLLLQASGGRFWVAIMDKKDFKPVRVRYYSNVAKWQHKLPATVQKWIASDVVLQWMSVPGTPEEPYVASGQ